MLFRSVVSTCLRWFRDKSPLPSRGAGGSWPNHRPRKASVEPKSSQGGKAWCAKATPKAKCPMRANPAPDIQTYIDGNNPLNTLINSMFFLQVHVMDTYGRFSSLDMKGTLHWTFSTAFNKNLAAFYQTSVNIGPA